MMKIISVFLSLSLSTLVPLHMPLPLLMDAVARSKASLSGYSDQPEAIKRERRQSPPSLTPFSHHTSSSSNLRQQSSQWRQSGPRQYPEAKASPWPRRRWVKCSSLAMELCDNLTRTTAELYQPLRFSSPKMSKTGKPLVMPDLLTEPNHANTPFCLPSGLQQSSTQHVVDCWRLLRPPSFKSPEKKSSPSSNPAGWGHQRRKVRTLLVLLFRWMTSRGRGWSKHSWLGFIKDNRSRFFINLVNRDGSVAHKVGRVHIHSQLTFIQSWGIS